MVLEVLLSVLTYYTFNMSSDFIFVLTPNRKRHLYVHARPQSRLAHDRSCPCAKVIYYERSRFSMRGPA